MHADLGRAGRLRELEAWEKFDVYSPHEACKEQKQIAQTRGVLTWKIADGKKCVKARLVARGFRSPELKEGLVGTSGRVSLLSSTPFGNGNFGVSISRMRSCRQMDLIAMSSHVRRRNGIRPARRECGS